MSFYTLIINLEPRLLHLKLLKSNYQSRTQSNTLMSIGKLSINLGLG